MENIYPALVVGIASSLVATVIFISMSELIRKIILPWYADKIYRGVRIDGEWEIKEFEGKEIESSKKSCVKLSLKQCGEKITGKYSHKLTDEIDEYILEGRVRDMFFLATAVPKSKRLIDASSFLLHIDYSNSKLIMTGGILYKSTPGQIKTYADMKFVWINS